MAKQSRSQKKTVERVMHEYKRGELKSGGRRQVKSPKQAVAIALSEAGASRTQSPAQKRRAAAHEGQGSTGPNGQSPNGTPRSQDGSSWNHGPP